MNPKHIQEDNRQIADALRAMMQHTSTRKFLMFLLETGRAFGNPNPFSPDPVTMGYACGMMAVGQAILGKMIEVDPEMPLRLIQEMESERRDRQRDDAGKPGEDNDGSGTGGDAIDADADQRNDFYRSEDAERHRIRDRLAGSGLLQAGDS